MAFCELSTWYDLDGQLVAGARAIEEEGIVLTLRQAEDPDWGMVTRRAFEFLRANGSRRYSNNSLMRVLNLADGVMEGRPKPYILAAEEPYSFDPDTEVKRGGVVGVMVQLNDGGQRALLATAPAWRRKGVARALLNLHLTMLGTPSLWVHRHNFEAQQFLLSVGLCVQEMNGQGVLRYSQDGDEE